MLTIYDTRRSQKVPFEPREPGKVSIYVCGPTVYDHPHLGHARSVIVYDVIRRYLEFTGLDVTLAANVTDIDDKIIKRAQDEGSTEPDVAARYLKSYVDAMDLLNVRHPDHRTHATEYIAEMHDFIVDLIDKGAAYVIDGQGVYFDVHADTRYGDLAGRSIEVLEEGAGARVEVDEAKKSPLDFALWKSAKPGEPTWDSPWGPGRPGWHTECVAMSLNILGEDFDIHGGGDDLVFPHHQNELAQAEAAGKSFSRYWLHHGMVNVEKVKMSKSLGNFTTVLDALDQHSPRAIRLLMLQTHYRKTLEIGRDLFIASQKAIDRLDALARRASLAGVSPAVPTDEMLVEFRSAMDDDFSTPNALGSLFEAVSNANHALDDGDTERAAQLVGAITTMADVLGIEIESTESESERDIDALVEKRQQARADKDFAEADRIRDELAAQGIVIEDTAEGASWRRV